MSHYYSVLRSEIAPLLPKSFRSIMDVGCGNGTTLNWVRESFPAVRAVGLEVNPAAAEAARLVCPDIHLLNIEEHLSDLKQYHGQIDVLLLLDVLEHLRDPWSILSQMRNFLSPEGIVIASIPNVRNLKVTLPLLFKGEWEYAEAGILDRTHLRFFTSSSVLRLFAGAGYEVRSLERTGPLTFRSVRSRSGLAAYLLNLVTLGAWKDFITHQFLVTACPARGARPYSSAR